MKMKVNGEDQKVEMNMGCLGCLFWSAILFWAPIIIIILIFKLL